MIPQEPMVRRVEWSQGEPVELAGQTWYLPQYGPREWFAQMEAADPAAGLALASGDPASIADSFRRPLAGALLINYLLSPEQLAELLPIMESGVLDAVADKLAKSIAEAGPVVQALERNRNLGNG